MPLFRSFIWKQGCEMKKPYIKYIAALLLFGSNGIVARYITLNSYEIVLLRNLIGVLFLTVIFIASKQKFTAMKHKRDFAFIAVSGIAMGGNWMFLYEAYTRIGVSLATLACYCGPVIVMMLAPLVFREKITAAKLIGFIAVVSGMFLVNRRELSQSGFSFGLICGIMSAVMYAVMVIFNKKAKTITGLENSVYQLAFSFVTVALFTLIKQGAGMVISPQSIPAILILGVINTGIGCYLYFSSIQHLPAQSVAICGYLEPVSALVLSSVFLNERLTAVQLIGTVLILGGAAFGELYGLRRK